MVNYFYQKEKEFLLNFDCAIVDIIIVLDSEWLATKLTSDLPSVKVITLPKSGGVNILFKDSSRILF
jgi:hypothetical protein